jgi:acetyl esterase/lipase
MKGVLRFIASALLLIALAACAPVDLLNATIPTGEMTITRDVAYGPLGRQKLDIYVPKGAADGAAVIVFFYGGSWQTGDKADYLFAAQALTTTGAIVVVPDYRVYPAVTFPDFIEDGAAATDWVAKNIRKWRGDPNKVFVAGHSAGAYIALMLALDRDYLDKTGIPGFTFAGAIGLSGPYDFLPLTRPDIKRIFEVVPDLAVTQPIHYARVDAPPLMLATGDADEVVNPDNTRHLADRVRELGGQVEERHYAGLDHTDTVIALTALFRGKAPVLADITAFTAAQEDARSPTKGK